MMRMKTRAAGISVSDMNGSSTGGGGSDCGGGGESRPLDWEVRPGGMLVQKRNPVAEKDSAPPPLIRLRVKYKSTYHEININSQATFGELKKMLVGATGLHHEDQKLIFKDRERDSKAFLDTSGVKDKSKIVLVEDPISEEKRYLEMIKNAKLEKAAKSISEIGLQVDKLAAQVSSLESVIVNGGMVAEKDVLNLTELLMNQLVKLDGIIIGDGDVKLQKKMQVRRVQKNVETLDVLKIKNSKLPPTSNGTTQKKPTQQTRRSFSNSHRLSPIREHQDRLCIGQLAAYQEPGEQEVPQRQSTSATVVTTQWETFDSSPGLMVSPSTPSTPIFGLDKPMQPKFEWEFFD